MAPVDQIKSPLFTVVVPVKDDWAFLVELSRRLDGLDEPPGGYEVVLVDDGSEDGGFELLSELCADSQHLTLVRSAGRGPAAARNLGIAAAQGDFVAFADSDTLPESDWLTQAASALDRAEARALEGAVLSWTDGPRDPLLRPVHNETGGRFMTANMVYETELLRELGGFDERFEAAFLEDSDIAFRAMDRGVEIRFVPEMRVRHRDSRIRGVDLLSMASTLQWHPLLAKKHPRRYREQLRPTVTVLRPGDIDLLLAFPLAIAATRGPVAVRMFAFGVLANALRRTAKGFPARYLPTQEIPLWALAWLLAPAARVVWLLRGRLRFCGVTG